MKIQRLSLIALVVALAYLIPSMLLAPRATVAMPEFAQATGLQCSACHTLVPLLNSYGRYVQRTGYAAIDRDSLDKTFPLWLGEQVNYNSTEPANSNTPQFDGGNLAIHAIGYAIPQVTYHIQDWIWQGSSNAGVLDTSWVAYNHLFSPDMHLFVGKILNPAPSPYSQTSDIDGPLASSTVAGEHDWSATYGNRWGTELAYTDPHYVVQAAYLLSGDNGFDGLSDFNPGDKTFQWRAALAQVKSPLEFGLFGSVGSIPVSTGTDLYHSTAAYAQLDPGKHFVPGAMVFYQTENDSNAGADANGNPYGAVQTYGLSMEVMESLFSGNALLTYRHDSNMAGSTGGYTNGNSVNLAFNIPVPKFPYLHGYLEANLGGNSTLAASTGGPTWKGELWLTVPLGGVSK